MPTTDKQRYNIYSGAYFFLVLETYYDFFLCFSATFSNISAMSWLLVLVVEEAGVPGENHRPWASNW